MSRSPCAAAVGLVSLSFVSPLAAQTVATLEVGPSIVEYEGFLVSGAAIASPALRYDTPNLSVGTQGTWVIFESGNEVLQWTAAAAWQTTPSGPWRAEFSGSVGASAYDAGSGSGHILARGRVHYRGERRGVWFSTATGQSFGDGHATPVELGLGGWTVYGSVGLAGAVTTSTVGGSGYVDVVGAARWSTPLVQYDVQAGFRPSEDGEMFGEFNALARLTELISVKLSAGTYASDPVRGVVGAKFLTAGLHLSLFRAPATPLPVIAGAFARAADALVESGLGSDARLEVPSFASRSRLRVHVSSATSIELMGDFTDWQPVALSQIREGVWEIDIPIDPGVHRVNIRIDGGRWLVPAGTRLEETEFGGAVGVVLVTGRR